MAIWKTSCHFTTQLIGKHKAIPVQALRVPGDWGSQNSRQLTHEGGKVVSLMHWPSLPLRKHSWYSCHRLSKPQGHSAAERIMSMKNSNYAIGNWNHDPSGLQHSGSNSYKIKRILLHKSGSGHAWGKRPCIRQFDFCISCSGIGFPGLSATLCYRCDPVHVMTNGIWACIVQTPKHPHTHTHTHS